MAGSTRALVGRRQESAALAKSVQALAGGTCRFVALQGEPGIGKSRLLEELIERGEQRGHLVLHGRGAELESDLPFGVWVDALDDHVAWLGPDRLERMLSDRVGELAHVLPSAGAGTGAAALPDERFRAHRAVGTLLERIAEPRPVVVVLDDLHWADGASLELLVHLLRRPPRAPVLIAVAFRAGRLPPSVTAALEAAQRDGRLVDLTLAPLSAREVGDLIGGDVAAQVQTELRRMSGGNPFYLLQLARATPAVRRTRDARRRGRAGGGRRGARPRDRRADRVGPSARPWRRGGRRSGGARARGRRRGACPCRSRSRRSTSSWPRTCCRPRTSRAATGSGIRSCGARSTSPPARDGGWAPTRAPPPSWSGAGVRSPRARTTSSAAR